MGTIKAENFNWVKVTDWSGLKASYKFNSTTGYKYYYSKSDITDFVTNLFIEVSKKIGIPYSDFRRVLERENFDFFHKLDCLFISYSGLGKDSLRLLQLQALLKIPDTTNITNVNKVFADFQALNDEEKLEFLNKLKSISIKVPFENQ